MSLSWQFAPFARGPALGIYADYDDWRGMQWGYCQNLATAATDVPSASTAPCATTASLAIDRGPLLPWPEPTLAA